MKEMLMKEKGKYLSLGSRPFVVFSAASNELRKLAVAGC